MMRLSLRRLVLAAGAIAASGCTFIVGTDGLSGGSGGSQLEGGGAGPGEADAAGSDVQLGEASTPPDSDAGSLDADALRDVSSADALATDAPPPDAGPIDTGPPTVCSTGRARVFVTAAFHAPNFGGLAGADAVCQKAADAQSLGSKWRAWLADGVTSAVAHVYAASKGYVLLDGTVVATSPAQLSAPPLTHAINRNEMNNPVTDGNTEVWTGYDPQASASAGTCSNGGGPWTSAANAASTPYVGHLDGVDDSWSAAYLQTCDRTNVRLYCFEACP